MILKRLRARRYNGTAFAGDLGGGLVAALIALPYGLAIASLCGLPPMLGIFTSILTAPFTALLGRNPVLIGGASSVTVPFLAVAVQSQGLGGAAKVTIVAAITMLVFSVLRLGRYAAMVPGSVMAGFSCGIGAMMFISQLRTILGLKIKMDPEASMLTVLARTLDAAGQMQWRSLVTALVVMLLSAMVARYWPKAPAPLLGIAAAVAISNLFHWTILEIGTIPSSVPPFAGFAWTPKDVISVLPAGIALGFVSSVNLLVTSRVVDHFRGDRSKKIDADRELGAYGIANLAAGMFGAPLSIGIPARSLANVRCGGTSRISNLAHALVLLLAVQYLGPVLSHIPLSALAGVTAWMGLSLMSWGTWARLPKMRRVDAAAFLVTAFMVVSWSAVAAVVAGCAVFGVRWLWHQRFTAVQPVTELSR
ncbi:MAG: SulP family inorganic anion transporter [Bryobacterales bacterium]|nr:SulP family inorganic anion transporter [Bryobacterales bacterium]